MTPLPNVRLLEKSDYLLDFRSGEPELDEWLHQFALSSHLSGGPRTYVAYSGHQLIGYYSLVGGSIAAENAVPRLAKGMGGYRQIATTHLARLAVDHSLQNQGYGRDLLLHAFFTAAKAAKNIGSRAFELHAINDDVRRWYMDKFNLEQVHPSVDPLDLYLLMKDVRATLITQGIHV